MFPAKLKCPACGKEKDTAAFTRRERRWRKCNACAERANEQIKRAREEINLPENWCKQCKSVLPPDAFVANGKRTQTCATCLETNRALRKAALQTNNCVAYNCVKSRCVKDYRSGRCEEHGGRREVWRRLVDKTNERGRNKLRECALQAAMLEERWTQQEGRCAYCLVYLRVCIGYGLPEQPSVERLDNDVGYVYRNVLLTCTLCNLMRNAARFEDFRIFLAAAYGQQPLSSGHPRGRPADRRDSFLGGLRNVARDNNISSEDAVRLLEACDGRCSLTGVLLCQCTFLRCPFRPSLARLEVSRDEFAADNVAVICTALVLGRRGLSLEALRSCIFERRQTYISLPWEQREYWKHVDIPARGPRRVGERPSTAYKQWCIGCNRTRDVAEFQWLDFLDFYSAVCRQCTSNYPRAAAWPEPEQGVAQAKYERALQTLATGVKKCSKCRQPQRLLEFSRNAETPDGCRGLCRGCDNARRMKLRLCH